MDEIASQLGVSKKTIYHSFSDKNELVDAVIGDMLSYNRTCCTQDRAKAQNAVEEVFLALDMMHAMFENMNPSILFDIERNYPRTYEKFKKHKYDFLFKVVKENVERGQREGLFRPEIDPDIVAAVRLEIIMMPFNENLFPKHKYSLAELEQQLTECFLFGLATQKGYKLITKYQKDWINQRNKNVV